MEHSFTVRGKTIGGGRIFMTAEIGYAPMGNINYAKTMIRAAADAGCDGCDMFSCSHGRNFAFSQFSDTRPGEGIPAYYEHVRKLQFTFEEWQELFRYADECGVILYQTPLDVDAVRMADRLGVPMVNINSDDINNPLLLRAVAELGVPVTMHDINATLSDVESAVMTLRGYGVKNLVVLHSTQESGDEDTLFASANLEVINTYRQAFGGLGVLAGCVEHTSSDFLIYTVAAFRPAVLSKHIYIDVPDRNVPDAPCSVNVEYYAAMVKKLRYSEMALGIGNNQLLVSLYNGVENTDRYKRRKVLVAARDIPAGKVIDENDIMAKRPGHFGGLSGWNARIIIGATARTDIAFDTILSFNHFENFPDQDYKFPELQKVIVKDINNARNA